MYIATWSQQKGEGKTYTLANSYTDTEDYEQQRLFFCELLAKKGTDSFHFLGDQLEEYYSNQNFDTAVKLLRIFLHKTAPAAYLRSILILSKGIEGQSEELALVLDQLNQLLSNKMGVEY